jgi:hypothetical protein
MEPNICNNCKTHLSCGCQRRTASDGKQCCDSCIAEYEARLTSIKPISPK